MTEIKICGIKNLRDVEIINEAKVAYAGFVLFEKSRRFVTVAEAEKLFKHLNPAVRKVAVTVSPNLELLAEAEAAGFDILQVHGSLDGEVMQKCTLPVWRAVNLAEPACSSENLQAELFERKNRDSQAERNRQNIQAVLVDAKEYGSGKTFDWEAFAGKNGEQYQQFRSILKENRIKFILAGGLNPENIAEGIRIFSPDAVDVSSGVEGADGKSRELVRAFVQKVWEAGI